MPSNSRRFRFTQASLMASTLLMVLTAAADEEKQPSVRDLDRLIGEWRYVDQSTELAGFEYREEGITRCEYTLDGRYIHCKSTGGAGKKKRTFIDYYTYNEFAGEFERISLFGNFPARSEARVTVLNDGQELELFGAPMAQRDGSTSRNWSRIKFTNKDNFVWETRLNRSHQAPDSWPLSFIGTYKRIEQKNADR